MTSVAPAPARNAAATMRAAVLESPGVFSLRSGVVPAPGPGEVRIRLEGSGVCGSSLPLFHGRDWFTYPQEPGAPGHEGWGTVDAVGDGVERVRTGDRVAALSYRAFAEFDIAREDAVVVLPLELASLSFPGEPLGCAMNVFRRSGVEPGETVAIVGIGFLGALLTRLCTNAGAHVIAISRRAYSLEVARASGAAETVPLTERWSVTEAVKRLTGGDLCDRVIEAVGSQQALDIAGDLVRERGRLVIAGFHQDGPRHVDMFQWNWRGIDVVNAHERDPAIYIEGIEAAVREVAAGRLDPTPLLTHRFQLDEVETAFRATVERPEGFLKALVVI